MKYLPYILIYLAVMSLISIVVCIYDKIASKHAKRHRTPEATLFGLSLLGGSVAMLATMLLIRHKTKHMQFMVGIPVIIVLQVLALGWLLITF